MNMSSGVFSNRSKSKSSLDLERSIDSFSDVMGADPLDFNARIGYRHYDFIAYYLGAVSMFMMQPTNKTNLESQLVAKIEEEQLDGKLKLKPVAEDTIRLRLDRHGIQVMRDDSDDIILRVPLHTLAQVVVFDDGFNKHNLAVKVICGKDLFSCHVFQCSSEDAAMSICENLHHVFRVIMAESDGSI